MRLESFHLAQNGELLASELISVAAVRVYILASARNAWHNTTSRRYLPDAVMFNDRLSAQLAAEPRRKQGTYFTLQDTPALRFDSAAGTVVIADFHPDMPFRTWGTADGGGWNAMRRLMVGAIMSDLVGDFSPEPDRESGWGWRGTNEHSVLMGVPTATADLARLGAAPFVVQTSYAQGRDWYLGWSNGPGRYSSTGVRRIVRGFQSNSRDSWRDARTRLPQRI